jgi:hypothetical protein
MNCSVIELALCFGSFYFLGIWLLPYLLKRIPETYHHKLIIVIAIILTIFFTRNGCSSGSGDDFDSNQVNDNHQGRVR